MDQNHLRMILGTRNEDTGAIVPATLPVTGMTAREMKAREEALASRKLNEVKGEE